MKNDLTSEEFGRLWRGFQGARVVLTAVELKLFDRLKTPRTVPEVARLLKTDRRATGILLDVLAALRLINKLGTRFSLTPVAKRHLLSGSPEYQGHIIMHGVSMWENWGGLTEVMKTGMPARRAFDHHSFIMGMDNLSKKRAPELVRAIPLKGVKTALDLGGGPGTNAIALASKGINVTLFDYPETIQIARKVARREGVALRFKGGDFMHHSINGSGKGYDLVLVSQIYHAYSPEDCQEVTARCFEALAPGGRIVVQEIPVDDTRTSPPWGALFAINMLVGTAGGQTYPPSEVKAWLKEAGFKRPSIKHMKETVLIQAVKPA